MKKVLLMLLVLLVSINSVLGFFISIDDSDPKPAEAGKFLNVWIRVANIDQSDATQGELFVEVIPKDAFELAAGEDAKKRIGILSASAYKVIPFRLKVIDDAVTGQNMLKVKITGQGYDFAQDLAIEVEENDILEVDFSVGTINSDPLRIKPGDNEVKIDITLLNLGDAQAKGIKAELTNLPKGISPSNSYNDLALIGTVGEDAQGIATFYLDVEDDVKAGKYSAILDLSYKYKPDIDEDEFKIEYAKIPVVIDIKSIPNYEITDVKFDRDVISAGDQQVKMTLTIKNIGEEKGEYIRVKAFTKTEQPFDFDVSSDFVSPFLEPGESAQATLEFDIDSDADLQEYQMELEIKNLLNEDVMTYQRKVPVSVAQAKQGSNIPMLALVIVIVAGGFFGVRKFMSKDQSPKKPKKGKGNYLEK